MKVWDGGVNNELTVGTMLHMTTRRLSSGAIALTAALTLGSLLTACSLGSPPRDRVAESAMSQLTQVLDLALTGAHVSDRGQLTERVRAAYPDVVQSNLGANLRYATFHQDGQRLADDVPVALALWERSTGADPFTDDVPRWHLYCAQLSVDRAQVALQTRLFDCPSGTPEAPDVAADQLQAAPVLDQQVPDDGALFVGQPARGGDPVGPERPTTPVTTAYPCAEDDLAVTFRVLSAIGNTDEAELRIVNTSTLACTVRGPLRLLVQQGREDRRITGAADQTEATLAPRESLSASISWRPSQKVSAEPQRITATVGAGDLPVRFGAGMPLAPVKADPGPSLVVGSWRVSGYGPLGGDNGIPPVDIAAPCDPDDIAARTEQPMSGSNDSEPPAPTVSVINLGVSTCRFGRGDLPAFQDLPGLPAFAPTTVTVLRPGEQVTAPTTTPVVHHPDQLLVTGRWVPTTPGQ